VIRGVLEITGVSKLSYIGFSQGTTQAIMALGNNPKLHEKINIFVALAPVTTWQRPPTRVLKMLANSPWVVLIHIFYEN